MSIRPTAAQLLGTPGALLGRGHLERRAVDAVFRALDVVGLLGYSRPLIRAEDYRRLVAESLHDGRTRVR